MNKKRKGKMIYQRIIGMMILLICAVIVIAAISARSPKDMDATAAVLFAPLGFWMLVSKNYMLD